MNKCLKIGIGGVSSSGKSTLSKLLAEELANDYPNIKILSQDDFTVEIEKLPKINGENDWDHPESIDWKKLRERYFDLCNTSDLVILEGLFVYYDNQISNSYDIPIFLKIPKEKFMERRRREKRWGSEKEWYLKHVWQAYLKYGLPDRDVIEIKGSSMWVMDNILERIRLKKNS